MIMDGNDLGITTDCSAGTPTLTKPTTSEQKTEII